MFALVTRCTFISAMNHSLAASQRAPDCGFGLWRQLLQSRAAARGAEKLAGTQLEQRLRAIFAFARQGLRIEEYPAIAKFLVRHHPMPLLWGASRYKGESHTTALRADEQIMLRPSD